MDRDSSLLARTGLTFGAILAVDALFAGVLALLASPVTAPLGDGLAGLVGLDRLPAVVRWIAVAGPVVGVLVWAQYRYARHRLLADVDATPASDESHPGLLGRVRRLSTLAGVRTPDVAVVDESVPNAFTVGGLRTATLVVSTGLLDRVDDEQLDAVLAHELAHVRNRDAAVLTLASLLPALVEDRPIWESQWTGVASVVIVLVGYVAAAGTIDAPAFGIAYTVSYVVFVVVSLLVGGVLLGLFALVVAHLSRRLSREREFAADRAAAQLTGSPATLATALETLTDDVPRPTADARERVDETDSAQSGSGDRSAHLATLCLLPHGFGEGQRTDGDSETFTVRTQAHPDTDERIDKLRSLVDTLA